MAVKKFKPTSAGVRFQTNLDFKEISPVRPEKRLTVGLRSTGGRNNQGRITSRFMGGGHKRLYRMIDFRRDKLGVPAQRRDHRVRPQPLGAHRAGPLRGRREALHPGARGAAGRRAGGLRARRRDPGRQRAAAAAIPLGTTIHNIELKRGKGGQMVALGGRRRAADGQGGRLRAGAAALGRGPRGPRRVLCDDRPGRQPRARERLDRQGRPQPLAGLAAAQPRRLDEPGRSPDGRRRGQDLGRAPPDARPGAGRRRARRRATTSGRDGFIVRRRKSKA